jgi:hypothetical protein
MTRNYGSWRKRKINRGCKMKFVFDSGEEQGYIVDDLRVLCDTARQCMPGGHVRVLEHFYVLAKTGLSSSELKEQRERLEEKDGC